MNTVTGNREGVPNMQDLLDAVPADRTVACLPTYEALILHDGEKELGSIPLDGVVDVSLLVDTSIKRRYPIGRSLLLGPLVLLFPKKTVSETYRICIEWKDPKGDYHFTYIRIPRRVLTDHMLNAVKHALTPEVRAELAQKVSKAKEQTAVKKNDIMTAKTSPFIKCGQCGMGFRKTDLPPGGKCPVCGKPFNVDWGL
jgi:hypothetical protein